MTIKRLFLTLALGLLATAFASWAQAFNPPSQSTMNNLPLYYPCSIHMAPMDAQGEGYIACAWLGEMQVEVFNSDTGKYFTTYNQVLFNCSKRGFCVGNGVNQGYEVGIYPVGDRGIINIWYYLDQSVEGHPMAYRFDQGPNANQPRTEYLAAANHIYEYYLDYGASEAFVERRMNFLYTGGLQAYLKDIQGGITPQEIGEVKSAWCNPRADDDCYINDTPVPIDHLKKYLKVIDEAAVEAAGGHCEYPVCYDANEKPIGVRS